VCVGPYPNRFDVLSLRCHREPTDLLKNPSRHVAEGLWGWNDIEGRRDRGPFFKVANPELTPGKLPLHVRLLLERKNEQLVVERTRGIMVLGLTKMSW
jgi:hypothetical protein